MSRMETGEDPSLMDSSAAVRAEDGEIAGAGGTFYRRSAVPEGAAWARVGVVHGYGDHSGRYVHFLRWLAERGVAVHAVDLRGHGLSAGRRGFVARWEEYLE